MPYNYARGRSLENRRESDKVRKKGKVIPLTEPEGTIIEIIITHFATFS